MGNELLVGPWLGEFGWEICTWVPYCRYISDRYDKTIVVCQSGREYLYQDFAGEFIRYDKAGKRDRWLYKRKPAKMPNTIIMEHLHATIKTPNETRCMSKEKKKYIRYGIKLLGVTEGNGYDILIHARARKEGQTQINWPKEKYEELAKSLTGKRIASVGTRDEAWHIKGTDDIRGKSLSMICFIMQRSKVIIGTSSGPLHLASLCGCSQVVITSDEYRKCIKGTNRDRYETLWNPFKTKVTIVDKYKWNPPVAIVAERVGRYL